MPPLPKTAPPAGEALLPRLFAALFGAFLGLSLLKFGNPPLPFFEQFVSVPTTGWEFVLNHTWPIAWAYRALAVVAAVGLLLVRRRLPTRPWVAALPLAWFLWQCLAASQSLRPNLSQAILWHFGACILCFYLGLFSLSRVHQLTAFWLGLLGAFLLILAVGWEQHFGGLEATRRYFFAYQYSEGKDVSPELLKRITSDRIFSTLFYANSLAGALLLLLPPMVAFLGQLRRQFTPGARAFLVGAVTLAALACLFWSGSKGGWLVMLLLGLLALLRLSFSQRLKLLLVGAVLLLGLAGFFVKYATFFHQGATSIGARFNYWQSAVQIAAAHPLYGTGPGTFGVPYSQIKRPDWEPARLTHNDYLEQACDSGLPGFVLYTGFILAALVLAYRKLPTAGWLPFALWLGVLGLAVQSLFEFGLYTPALAWPAFAVLGYLLAQDQPVPNPPSPASLAARSARSPH